MATALMLEVNVLDSLFAELQRRGLVLVGPTVRDGAIGLDELATWRDLPGGWTDEQDAGTYQLRPRDDGAVFGFSNGPQSWKRFLFPPSERVASIRLGDKEAEVEQAPAEHPRYAFIGVRACDLAAIAVQDRVFLGGSHPDPAYGDRRDGAFIVAVQCTEPGGTCFCTSTGTGPGATSGFDLVLTEVREPTHHFVAESGSARGEALLAGLPGRQATAAEVEQAAMLVGAAAGKMGRTLDTGDLPGLLTGRADHPHWDDVAERCLACANCTLVCPTCFCSTVEDTADLDGQHAERWRHWDSCFTLDFSFLGGGSVRSSTRSRYRQWLTHKLDTWWDQFGTSGCVGCGRCITWCPVGIDLTEEIPALRVDGVDR